VLPLLPVLVFLLELIACLGFGMHLFGETMSRRLGELTICFLIWLVLARALIVLGSFTLAFANLQVQQRQSWAGWLVTFSKELAAATFAFSVLIPLRSVFAPKLHATRLPPIGNVEIVTVLYVHGLLSNAGVWWLFDRRLKQMFAKQKIPLQTDSLDLEPPFASIDSYVERLDRHLQRLLAQTQGPVILVAHSMGGLVCRAWSQAHSNPRIARLITLGTPHQGSVMANRFHFKNLRQMQPGSEWLNRLGIEQALRTTSIYSRHDNLVVPYLAGSFGVGNLREVKGIGHLGLLFDPDLTQYVADEINYANQSQTQ
jgi:pimeloyl-ACP methyl ester carboxylesterase